MEKVMKHDVGLVKENNWFRYRTGGIIIHDNKMLFVKSIVGGYYYMIGGGVHMGETSTSCIEREILEEAGIRAKVDYLAVVSENFFKGKGGTIDGMDCHTIEFYYFMKLEDVDSDTWKSTTDEGEELVWVPIDEIRESDIKPSFMKEYVGKIINERKTFHVIEEKDR